MEASGLAKAKLELDLWPVHLRAGCSLRAIDLWLKHWPGMWQGQLWEAAECPPEQSLSCLPGAAPWERFKNCPSKARVSRSSGAHQGPVATHRIHALDPSPSCLCVYLLCTRASVGTSERVCGVGATTGSFARATLTCALQVRPQRCGNRSLTPRL